MKNKGIKIFAIIFAVILIIGIGLFSYLFFNGLSGLHIRKDAQEGQIKVACVGDSITYGHGVAPWHSNNYPAVLQTLLGENYNVQNFGVSGTTAQKTGDQPYIETDVYKQSVEYNADILIFMLGSNDSKPENWKGDEAFKEQYISLLDTYITEDNSPKIYLGNPAKAFYEDENQTSGLTSYDIQGDVVERIGGIVKEIAAERGYKYIDIYELTKEHPELFVSDLVHPNANGAKEIAEEVCEFVTDIKLVDFVGKSDVESQIKLIVSNLNDCINNIENFIDAYGIAITDLNFDNHLEIIVATCGGTGNLTNCYVFEINDDYTNLYECDIRFDGYKYIQKYEKNSNADVFNYDKLTHFYQNEQHFYILKDTGRCGWAEQYNEKVAVSLNNGIYLEKTLAYDISLYELNSKEPDRTIKDFNDKLITETEFNTIEDKYFEGYNKDTVQIAWTGLMTHHNYPNGFLSYTDKELVELLINSYYTFIGN